jgi:thiamine-phosphate pyrophosphorylase
VSAWGGRKPILYFVTDRNRLPGGSTSELLVRIRTAVHAGIDVVQIRERDLSDRALADLIREAVSLTRNVPVQVLVNDRFDIAVACGADGVHLRSDSVGADRIRTLAPPGFLIGRSVHSRAEAEGVVRSGGCDYLMFGTVYPSAGKPPGHPVGGEAALAEVCRTVTLPVIAIGGIDEPHSGAIAATGAAGIAAIRAFTSDNESALTARVRAMRRAFDSASPLV